MIFSFSETLYLKSSSQKINGKGSHETNQVNEIDEINGTNQINRINLTNGINQTNGINLENYPL